MTRLLLSLMMTFLVVLQLRGQQDSIRYGEIRDASFIIEKDKQIVLPRATRRYQPFNFKLPAPNDASYNYKQSSRTPNLDTFSPTRLATGIKSNPTEEPSTYIKLGGGNFQSFEAKADHMGFIGDISYHGKLSYMGFGVGPVNKEESWTNTLTTGIGLYKIKKNRRTGLEVEYGRRLFFYYGLDENVFVPPITIEQYIFDKQIVNCSKLKLFYKQALNNGTDLATSLEYNLLGMNHEAIDETFNREGNLTFQADLTKPTGNGLLGTDMIISYSHYTGLNSFNRTNITLNPYYQFEGDKLNANLGLFLFGMNDDPGNQWGIWPAVRIRYSLSDNLNFHLSSDPEIQMNTLEEMLQDLIWLSDSIELTSTRKTVTLESGLSGKLSKKLDGHISLGYHQYNNMQFYFPGDIYPARFIPIYATGAVQNFALMVGLTYYPLETISITGNMGFNEYQLRGDQQAWLVPTRELHIQTEYRVFDHWKFQFSIDHLGGIKAPDITGQELDDFNSITDLSLFIDYNINDKLSCYLHGLNLLNNSYERYPYYPVLGFNFKAGLSIRF